jgi:hypothetical protein
MVLQKSVIMEEVKRLVGAPVVYLEETAPGQIDSYLGIAWEEAVGAIASYTDVKAVMAIPYDQHGNVWLNDIGISPDQIINVYVGDSWDQLFQILLGVSTLYFAVGSRMSMAFIARWMNFQELNKFGASWDVRYEQRNGQLEPKLKISLSTTGLLGPSGGKAILVYNPNTPSQDVLYVPSGRLAIWVKEYMMVMLKRYLAEIRHIYGQSVQLGVLGINLAQASPEDYRKEAEALLDKLVELVPPPAPRRVWGM